MLPERQSLSQQYSLICWIIYTFLGGAINTVAMQYFVSIYQQTVNQLFIQLQRPVNFVDTLPQMAIPIIILVTLPIVLSLIFSKFSPEIQLVSPLNMQIISLAALILLYGLRFFEFSIVFSASFYTLFVGWMQDQTAIYLVGRIPARDNILTASFKVETDAHTLCDVLLTKKYRTTLKLQKKSEELDCGILLKGESDEQYQTRILLTGGEKKSPTFLDMALFEKGRYALKMTDELGEQREKQVRYLKSVFERAAQKKPIGYDENASSGHVDELCDLVIDELQGKTVHLQRVTTFGWLKTLAVMSSLALCFTGYFLKWLSFENTLVILIPTVVYLVLEYPIRKAKERT